MTENKSFTIKATRDKETRRITWPRKESFESMRAALFKLFKCEPESLYYWDEESDLITIDTQTEWEHVIEKIIPEQDDLIRIRLGENNASYYTHHQGTRVPVSRKPQRVGIKSCRNARGARIQCGDSDEEI